MANHGLRQAEKQCKKCKRPVDVLKDGSLVTHGPGPKGEFICPGSGDKGMVRAAKRLNVVDVK